MNSVRANLCGGVEFFEKKKVRGLLSQTASSQSTLQNYAFNLTLIIIRANLLLIIISFRTSMYIFISPKISKSIFVEEEEQEEGDLTII